MLGQVEMSDIVSIMISKFDTVLHDPEDPIVKQLDDDRDMYLIAKGACEVTFLDERGAVPKTKEGDNKNKNRTLRHSDYFGEISMVYGCKRTANVQSTKYSTLAKLSYEHYREILIEFPDLQEQLKQHIYRYNDKQKRFMLNSMRKVEFFNGIGDNATHDIMYSFIGENFSKDDYLQEPGDNATNLYFLQEGVIEIETKCDDIDFTLEKLFRGSVINYRTFFMEEDGQVYYKFGKNSILFTLAYEKMEELCKKHEDLNKKFQKFKQQTIMREKPFPLDYIMELPKHLKDKTKHMTDFSKRLELENRLKNIVIRMLVDIRAKKAKPSLKDMINQYLKKKAEKDERARIRIKEQVLEIYEQKNFEQIEENDPNFNKIIVHIERVLKITTA
jgi:CRP-like cAMP-binding protein